MAERPLPAKPCCELEYAFDRLHSAKLEQAFAILVPNRERRVDEPTGPRGALNEDSRHLRPRLLTTIKLCPVGAAFRLRWVSGRRLKPAPTLRFATNLMVVPRLLGPAERGEDHSQPDGGTEGGCPPRSIPGAG